MKWFMQLLIALGIMVVSTIVIAAHSVFFDQTYESSAIDFILTAISWYLAGIFIKIIGVKRI